MLINSGGKQFRQLHIESYRPELEASNAALIEQGLPKPERILRLSKKAQERMLLLVDSASGQELAKHLEPSAEVRQLGASQEEE